MTCPYCGKQAMSFWQFVWKINPSRLKCNHCQQTFQLVGVGKALLVGMTVFAFSSGSLIAMLPQRIPLTISIPVLFIILSAIGFPLEYYLWQYAKYEKSSRKKAE